VKIMDKIHIVGSGHFGLSHDFDSSVYIVDCDSELVMIDSGAGCETNRIINNMEKDKLDPLKISGILLTHGHADHAGGAYYFNEKYGSSVCIGTDEADLVEKGDAKDLMLDVAVRSGFYSSDYVFTNCKVSRRLDHNDKMKFGDLTFHALHVPGHSPGSFCYLLELSEGRTVFTGDTVFAEGIIGLLNCDGSDLSSYRKYIQRLSGLNVDMLFPGHRVFVLSDGQSHIDKAVESLKLLQLPRNFI